MKYTFPLILLLFFACKESVPKLTQADLLFAKALANVYLANAATEMIEEGSKDSTRRELTVQALKLTDMDTSYFQSQLHKYSEDPMRLKIIYDSCTSFLERVQKQKLQE